MHFYVMMISIYVVLAAAYWLRRCEAIVDSKSQEKSQDRVNEK